jgi:hypothetical protein
MISILALTSLLFNGEPIEIRDPRRTRYSDWSGRRPGPAAPRGRYPHSADELGGRSAGLSARCGAGSRRGGGHQPEGRRAIRLTPWRAQGQAQGFDSPTHIARPAQHTDDGAQGTARWTGWCPLAAQRPRPGYVRETVNATTPPAQTVIRRGQHADLSRGHRPNRMRTSLPDHARWPRLPRPSRCFRDAGHTTRWCGSWRSWRRWCYAADRWCRRSSGR